MKIIIGIIVAGAVLFTTACDDRSAQTLEAELGEAHRKFVGKDMDGALRIYEKVLAEEPDSTTAAVMAAKIYYFKMEFPRAEKVLVDSCEQDGPSIDCLFWLAKTRSVMTGRQAQALETLELLLSRDSAHIEAWILKGRLLEKQGRMPQAIDAYHFAINESKKAAPAHMRLSELYREYGMPPQSAEEYQSAMELSRDNPALREQIKGRLDPASRAVPGDAVSGKNK